MELYKSFNGGGRGVHIYLFLPAVFGIKILLCFTIFLTWFWKMFVGSVATVWKLFSHRNFSILFSYWRVGRITMELPLSALVTVTLYSCSFVWVDFISLVSLTRYVGKVLLLFRRTDLKIAFRTKNTIGNLLIYKISLDRQTYICYPEHTNFPALIAIRHTSDKLVVILHEVQRAQSCLP